MLMTAYKYDIQAKDINNTETKRQQRPTIPGADQFSWPFRIKKCVLVSTPFASGG